MCDRIRTVSSYFRARQNCVVPPQGKRRAEARKICFCSIKISTQVLISVWKSLSGSLLTCRPSTLFSSLHHSWATHSFSRRIPLHQTSLTFGKICWREILRDSATATLLFLLFLNFFLLKRCSRPSQYHFGGLSRCTLMVCFGSVMSSHRPYVFQPSAMT